MWTDAPGSRPPEDPPRRCARCLAAYNAGMTTLFISDLHLDPERPDVTRLFGEFLQREARQADALYILGDLFEAWVGDDDPSEVGAFVADRLRAVADAGVPVLFQHGNRDFLLGRDYARRAGMRLLPETAVVSLYGRPALLMHGDALCTGDTAYQAFRTQTRDPRWQAQFLAQPLAARLAFAARARAASAERQQTLKLDDRTQFETITDADPQAVVDTLALYGVDMLIHGHTHRPAVHQVDVHGRQCRRVVLGDWYIQGSVLRVDAKDLHLEALPL